MCYGDGELIYRILEPRQLLGVIVSRASVGDDKSIPSALPKAENNSGVEGRSPQKKKWLVTQISGRILFTERRAEGIA